MRGLDTEKGLCAVRLLLVDDDAFSRKLTLEILHRQGIAVDMADNGAEAVEKVGQADYAAVLMDCRMPVMDGFEATRKIRADKRFANLPILAMSGDATEDDRQKCLECGMNGCIEKPLDVGQLFTTLAHWIKLDAPAVFGQGIRAAAYDDAAPNIPGLEIDKALRHLDGNVNLFRKLISRFGATQADTVTRIRAAIDSGDTETAIRTAHTFKGVAGNIGATRMFERAATVEGMLKQGGADDLTDVLDAMERELHLLLQQIAVAMQSYEPPVDTLPDGCVDMATFSAELRDFAALLASGDSRARKLAGGIASRLGAAGQDMAASQLKEFISRYDFQGATDTLKKAAQALGIVL
ncbi:MAG: response regulator [Gallionella sp.]|nr:response regulator [Gallionella sp.]